MNDEKGSLNRRQALGAIGAAAGATAFGGARSFVSAATVPHRTRVSAIWPDCVVTPAQTEGPYFVDKVLERADIRVDPTDGSVTTGLPLRLRLGVHRVDSGACSPVTGAQVDVWQCDAAGIYSAVRDTQGLFDTREKKFLRGYQVTDASGVVEFQTIYPGWYPGRTPHIHFKIRLSAGSQRAFEFTSQLYFEEATNDRVYALAPYSGKGERTTRNNRDGIFQREGGPGLILRTAQQGSEWHGVFDVGLRMS